MQPRGIRNVYYICPQFWAWRPWRVNLIRRRFAKALCIFPFEEKFFRNAGVPTEFIGHPLVGEVNPTRKDRRTFCQEQRLDPSRTLVTILPGSRAGRLAHHLPVLQETCARIHARKPSQFIVAAAHAKDVALLKAAGPVESLCVSFKDETYNALAAADVAIVSSGTATVEAALLNTPMVVVYRVSPLTAILAKPLVRTAHFAMVNLIADKQVVPELVQDDFTPDRVAEAVLNLLHDPNARTAMKEGLAEVRRRLGPPGAVNRAADQIALMLSKTAGNAS